MNKRMFVILIALTISSCQNNVDLKNMNKLRLTNGDLLISYYNNLNVREYPGTNSAIITQLNEYQSGLFAGTNDTNVFIIEFRGSIITNNYVLISFTNGMHGWIFGGAVKKINELSIKTNLSIDAALSAKDNNTIKYYVANTYYDNNTFLDYIAGYALNNSVIGLYNILTNRYSEYFSKHNDYIMLEKLILDNNATQVSQLLSIMSSKKEIDDIITNNYYTAQLFKDSISVNNTNIINELIKHGLNINVNLPAEPGVCYFPLDHAVEQSNIDMITYLISIGARADHPLFTAISANNDELIDLLLKYYNINSFEFYIAIEKGNLKLVKYCISKGLGLDSPLYTMDNENLGTPLEHAKRYHQDSIAEYLISKGAK